MKFHDYIKKCREENSLTQEQLIDKLYLHNTTFKSLDTVTLSRWERNITQPSIDKKLKIIKFFSDYTGIIFPYFNAHDYKEIEDNICKNTIDNILGKNKELVLNYPSNYIEADELKIQKLRDIKDINNIIDISVSLDQEFTQHFSQLKDENFLMLAKHPASSFFICEYKEQFFGLLFSLHLKKDIFEKLMNFEMQEVDIKDEHFVVDDEVGCEYLLNFFSYSQKVAALLFISYYNYLIDNQKQIIEIGVGTDG